ncbi:HAD family hydrolase [bacterium]|nr:HAD family hydrolase [bacterium]
MNGIHQILFDFDYTLADSSEGIIRCVNYALSQVGKKTAEPSAIRKMIGHSLEETFGQFVADPNIIAQCKQLFMEHADTGTMVDHTFMLAGVEETLEILHDNFYTLGIVSTKRRSTIKDTLMQNQADDLFDVIIGYEDVKNLKPDPEGIFKAIDFMGGTIDDTLYVGDSVIDALAARNARVKMVGVTSGTTDAKTLSQNGVNEIIKNLNELLTVLQIEI